MFKLFKFSFKKTSSKKKKRESVHWFEAKRPPTVNLMKDSEMLW